MWLQANGAKPGEDKRRDVLKQAYHFVEDDIHQLKEYFSLKEARIVVQESQTQNDRRQQLNQHLKLQWGAGEREVIFYYARNTERTGGH